MPITKKEYAGRDAAPVILYTKTDADSDIASPVLATVLVIITGGLVPKGEYAGATDYAVGDWVSYNGSSYVMYVDATAGTLPTDTTKWQVVVNGTARYTTSFVDGDLTAGVLTVNHALGIKVVLISIYDNNDKLVSPDEITLTDTNNIAVDLSSYGTIAGTWNARVVS